MWFLSAGLAIIFAGLLNLVLLRDDGKDSFVRLLCLIADSILFLLFGAALSILEEPQVYIGLMLLAFETVAAFTLGKNNQHDR